MLRLTISLWSTTRTRRMADRVSLRFLNFVRIDDPSLTNHPPDTRFPVQHGFLEFSTRPSITFGPNVRAAPLVGQPT
jgi:hypothetical protein